MRISGDRDNSSGGLKESTSRLVDEYGAKCDIYPSSVRQPRVVDDSESALVVSGMCDSTCDIVWSSEREKKIDSELSLVLIWKPESHVEIWFVLVLLLRC
jgi:hypothetical protein